MHTIRETQMITGGVPHDICAFENYSLLLDKLTKTCDYSIQIQGWQVPIKWQLIITGEHRVELLKFF